MKANSRKTRTMAAKKKTPSQSSTRAEQVIRLRVICRKPPSPEAHGATFGLQDNSTTAEWVIHAGRTDERGDIRFECECRVRPHPRTGAPVFLGPFTHGDAATRFLYLSWRPARWRPGHPTPPAPAWLRRIKVSLASIDWKQVDAALAGSGVLEATVMGTGRDGGPNCATVPLVGGGWKVGTA